MAQMNGQSTTRGPAAAYENLGAPKSLAFSPQGMLYVVPASGGRILQVLGQKTSAVFAETGGTPEGLAFDAGSNLYAADPGRHAVLRIDPAKRIAIAASRCEGAPLDTPWGVAAAAGHVYFTDRGRNRVCVVTKAGEAGVVTKQIERPMAIAAAADGAALYVTDAQRNLWRVATAGGTATKLATVDGPGDAAAVAIDERGNLYVARCGAGRVAMLTRDGHFIREIGFPGTQLTGAAFGDLDASGLFVTEASAGIMYRFAAPYRGQRTPVEPVQALRLTFPLDGDILNRHDGEAVENGLRITVEGIAPPSGTVQVNGTAATVRDGRFQAPVVLRDRESRIAATFPDGSRDEVKVLWDRDSYPRYRFSIDDNILFLKDIAENAARYHSLFDNAYLAFWREMHTRYGAKIHFNLYYETPGFTLDKMPDKFKSEWQANQDWIRLSFHARSDKPDRPYLHASGDQILADFEAVRREVYRFAGPELWGPVTTVHWGAATLEGMRALRKAGVTTLAGYFDLYDSFPIVSYYLTAPQVRHLMSRDYWKDTREDLLFVRHDMVVNIVPLDQIPARLEELVKDPHHAEVIELMIHEQYYHPDYVAYEPDYRQRVERAIAWVTGRGYRPVFYGEGFLGAIPAGK